MFNRLRNAEYSNVKFFFFRKFFKRWTTVADVVNTAVHKLCFLHLRNTWTVIKKCVLNSIYQTLDGILVNKLICIKFYLLKVSWRFSIAIAKNNHYTFLWWDREIWIKMEITWFEKHRWIDGYEFIILKKELLLRGFCVFFCVSFWMYYITCTCSSIEQELFC